MVTATDDTTDDGSNDDNNQDGDTELDPVARLLLEGHGGDVARGLVVVRVSGGVGRVGAVVVRGHSTASPCKVFQRSDREARRFEKYRGRKAVAGAVKMEVEMEVKRQEGRDGNQLKRPF